MEKIKDQIVDETLKFVDAISALRENMVEFISKQILCESCKEVTEHQLFMGDRGSSCFVNAIAKQCLGCLEKTDIKQK